MAPITLNGNTIDLTSAGFSQDASLSENVLMQFRNDLTNDNLTALKAAEVQLQEYVGNKTYICQYKQRDLAALQKRLSFIGIAVVYPHEFVISRTLKTALDLRPDGAALDAQGQVIQGWFKFEIYQRLPALD